MAGGEFHQAGNSPEDSALIEYMSGEEQRQEEDRQAFVKRIQNGESTGNELHDQLIRWRGENAFDKRLLEFYEHVNETITGRDGEPFAVTISDTSRSESGGCFDTGEVTDGFDYVVYGILTGESLQLKDNEQSLAIPAVDWVQSSKVANTFTSGSSLRMGVYYVREIANQLEQAESDAVPLMPFEQSGAVYKIGNRDFHIAVGSEEIQTALRDCEHMSGFELEFALSVAELHQQYDLGRPIPGLCKGALVVHKGRMEKTVQEREETIQELRSKRSRLQDEITKVDGEISEINKQRAHLNGELGRISRLQDFFPQSADQSSE